MATLIEERARELDEARRVRLLKSEDIDTEKYLKANDVTHKVNEATTWLGEMQEELVNPSERERGQVMPWPKTHSSFAFRPGEVTIYAGTNGSGKSMVTGQVALGLVKQKQKVCIASFEMKPKRSLYRMLRQFSGQNLDVPAIENNAKRIGGCISRFSSFASDRLWMYDQQGTTSSRQVIAMSRYCAVELGIKHVFIDSLMKCVPAEDDYNAQKYFVDELTALARDHSIHVHLVHHLAKLQTDDQLPSKRDVKGSGAITDQVDNVLLVHRNKKKEHKFQAGQDVSDLEPDATLMCEKQRNGEAEEWYGLWYNRECQQFVEAHDSLPMCFDAAGAF